MAKVWFITGTSRGFGREFALAALGRGDKVAATARDLSTLDDLVERFGDAILPIELDVTDRAAVFAGVEKAFDQFGRLDVVVNNAGYGLFGMAEELSEEQFRHQVDVNLFGVFHVVQAVLPKLRAQGSGHIVQISTVGAIGAFAGISAYNASKWALEGFSEALAQEVAGFGIKVTMIEPGAYATDWAGPSAIGAAPLPAYDGVRAAQAEGFSEEATRPADPAAGAQVLLKIVDADNPPLRLLFGSFPVEFVQHIYQQRLTEWDAWKELSIQANG
ncbi:SDR family NAD(P)-dependent oxidoreductase [Microbacterium sp. RURRCA19A]|uniref:SDR family NAD(P)-dependent oxidoreductase n=1 Tax=Microbacterium sp. RURRCA19A TaxID=1907391 RepID=UPI0009539EAD|nr:SDR family NAD(P)-dependent oxidoreductase [Microbacterium sp. RURRCA19A]SIR56319.1 NADP-dependent 3-hydroxy acid dehydrogenase YdfG [Microbacterium sp. RURRCA19A]